MKIRACRATGGVTCVSGVSLFLGKPQPTAQDVARHAVYVADRVGIAHTGFGLDICLPQNGLDDTPPGDHDAGYWWPVKFTGYERGLTRTTFTPVETWQLLPNALGPSAQLPAVCGHAGSGGPLRCFFCQ
jgi:membrane dipeptidase